jgi:hypothetical protein
VGSEKMNWQELTSPALGKISRRTPVVLPIAAIEQHGPHLPLATDRLIVEHLCEQLNRELKHRVLILPTLAFGCSMHHIPRGEYAPAHAPSATNHHMKFGGHTRVAVDGGRVVTQSKLCNQFSTPYSGRDRRRVHGRNYFSRKHALGDIHTHVFYTTISH